MDLVLELPLHLDVKICESIIDRFEASSKKGANITKYGYRNSCQTIDLSISHFMEWEDIVNILDEKMKEAIKTYKAFLSDKFNTNTEFTFLDNKIQTEGYTIAKSGKYDWHSDNMVINDKTRYLTFIWYLNTRNFDGETDFVYKKVKPEAGKLVMFPSTWEYLHKGHLADGKYIVTTWLLGNE
jgi:hypothetical protein